MPKFFRTGVIVVVVPGLLSVGGGVAAADPNPADPCPPAPWGNIPNVCQFKDNTHWRLIVRIENITIKSVPNMAATPTTREGYVTATATEQIVPIDQGNPAEATQPGPSVGPTASPDTTLPTPDWALTGGQLKFNAMTGCQWDASGGLQPTFGENITGPGVATTLTPGATTPPSITLSGPSQPLDANPQLTWQVKPGVNNPAGLAPDMVFTWEQKADNVAGKKANTMTKEEMTGGLTRVISVQEQTVRVPNCGGPVAVRLEAQAIMNTMKFQSVLTGYSDIVPL